MTLQNERRVVASSRGGYYAVAAELLRALMAPMIGAIVVDEDWYLDTNPDVAAAVRQGVLRDGAEHYRQSGYFEDRMPYRIVVDEAWYQEQYEDIARAVANGLFESGQHHFESVGYREGRYPFPGFALRTVG
jgi:hypothetical protein